MDMRQQQPMPPRQTPPMQNGQRTGQGAAPSQGGNAGMQPSTRQNTGNSMNQGGNVGMRPNGMQNMST